MMCPNCHSIHVQKNNYARKAGATIGFTAGGTAGWGGASVGAQAGAVLRLVLRLGQQLDWLQVQLAQLLAVLQVVC